MDARHSGHESDHGALSAFNEMMNQSRTCFERSFAAMREETVELLHRLHDRNGEVLAEYQNGTPNLAKLTAAQEKWFVEMSREMYEATMRLHETARTIMAESLESVGHSMRNGRVGDAALDAEARGNRAMRATRAEVGGESH
jgi:hypothetical protein